MKLDEILAHLDREALGRRMHELVVELYPICRSITGDGVRSTLRRLQEIVPLQIHEIATGTPVFDWQVPREWNVQGATLRGPKGEKVVDFADHNLHLVNYSIPTRQKLSLGELRPHLHSLPEKPDLIPYRTSYYKDSWGFCLAHRQLETLVEGEYEAHIDTTLEEGSLTWGELFLPGSSDEEILISCHVCHPSLANDNLSSIAMATCLGELLATTQRRYGVRIVFAPGTIGAIVWLALNAEGAARRIRHGIVAANLGDPGSFHYKRSRRGDAEIDRIVPRVLADAGLEHEVLDFIPFGYDERQYCSPGFDLPVGQLTRTPWGQYPEYHTSGDNPDLVRPEALASSLSVYLEVLRALEGNRKYRNLEPFCEPQLGRRGLYRQIGGGLDGRDREIALLWVLNLSDGEHSLLDIADRAGMSFQTIRQAADALIDAELLEPID